MVAFQKVLTALISFDSIEGMIFAQHTTSVKPVVSVY